LARFELEPSEIRRLARDFRAPGHRIGTDLHPRELREFDRLRCTLRAEALRDAVSLWTRVAEQRNRATGWPLKRIENSCEGRRRRITTTVHPVQLHDLDRLRSGSRTDAVREAVLRWTARELRREARRQRLAAIRRAEDEMREAEDQAWRKIREIMDGAGLPT
jgi:hypothetical protein